MLMKAGESLLWVVDLQTRLVPAINNGEVVADACLWLVDVATELNVPVRASAQYPRGLGRSVEGLLERIGSGSIVDKMSFSCSGSSECVTEIEAVGRRQVVLCGIEAHVCVLQTALGLCERGYDVYVVADAVGSRRPADCAVALERLRQQGVSIVSREMVAFEWLGMAGTDAFKRVSRGYLR